MVRIPAALLGLALAFPAPAQAWWVRRPVVVAPLIVAPAPVVVAPPVVVVTPSPVFVAPRPVMRWVPPHYNRWGYFVPGHWG